MKTSYQSKLKQKRGIGRGKDYIPWIKVREFSGKGNNKRVLGLKSGRIHNFLSNFEASLFYIFDLDKNIEEIREQFPLLEVEIAKELAEEAGIRYPSDKNDEPHILTSDYFLTYTDGREVAITMKYLKDITKRQLELFEVERRYWNVKGIQWKIVTELEMPSKDLLMNYEDIHSALRGFIEDNHSDEKFQVIISTIIEYYEHSNEISLTQFTNTIDSELKLQKGSTLRLFKVLIAKGLITTDLTMALMNNERKMKDLLYIRNMS